MNLLRYWGTKKFFSIAAIYYLLFLLLFYFTQKAKFPDSSIVFMQIMGMGMIVFFSFLYDKLSISRTMLILVVYLLICCFGLRFFNMDYFNNPLGYKPQDALLYHNFGSHIEQSLLGFIRFMKLRNVQIDDMGFTYIVYLIYRLSGDPEIGIQLLVLFNVVVISISSYFLYKLSNFFFEKHLSCFIAFFWGTELYAVYTASVGLKENFMVMFIIIAIYYIIRVNKHLLSKDIFYAVLFSLPILLFRTAMFFMLMCVLLYILALRIPLVKRYLYFFTIIIIYIASVYAYTVIEELAIMQGSNYETIQHAANYRVQQGGSFTYLLNYLASLIGPFPNLVTGDFFRKNYITLYSFSSFCKVFYSFFFIYGIFRAFRNKSFEMIGITIFWILNTFMLLIMLFAQHDRYQWPHMPFTIILAVYGLKCWNENRHVFIWDKLYLIAAILVVLVFNFR